MKRFLTLCTGLLFLTVLFCSSGMPLVMAAESGELMAGCPSEQTQEKDTDASDTGSNTSCDHSEKLSFEVQLFADTSKDQLIRVVALFFPVLESFITYQYRFQPVSSYIPPDRSLVSQMRSHQTIVLRF